MITIVGLGPGNPHHLTIGALEALRSGRPVLLRTAKHPTVAALDELGISYETCDDLYDQGESFETLYEAIADRVLSYRELIFAVPGHPLVGENSVRLIMSQAPLGQVEVISGPSFLDTLLVSLGLDPIDGLELLDALQLDRRLPSGDLPAVIMQLHSRAVASEAKLALMERYPDEHMVTLVRAAGVPTEERRMELPLHQLDHQEWVDYLTSLYVPPLKASEAGQEDPRRWIPARWPLDPLVAVMATLRGPQGCPWDREQSHRSLRPYMIEEAYEAAEAIDQEDPEHLCEELGDLLLQIAFHAQLAQEAGQFDMHDIVQGITAKLVRRHPHVFADVQAPTSADVMRNWEAIKRSEKVQQPVSLLEGIPGSLPALSRAFALQKKAAKVGFDWAEIQGAVAKVKEELEEVLVAGPDEVESEVGDLLFAAVNLARKLKVEPELALTTANAKFTRRFQYMEAKAVKLRQNLTQMSHAAMDQLWNEAKKEELGEKIGKG